MDQTGLGGAPPSQGDPVHPNVLQNTNPESMMSAYESGVLFLQAWGWYIVFGIIAVLFLKNKFDPQIQAMRKRRQEQDYANFDASTARNRQEAMEMARARMQEQHDAKAAKHAEETKVKEEQKRKERIEDWERHQKGGGYRSKYKPPETTTSGALGGASSSSNSQDKKNKKPLRSNDFNPLMGGSGGGACFRPPRRGGGGGGG